MATSNRITYGFNRDMRPSLEIALGAGCAICSRRLVKIGVNTFDTIYSPVELSCVDEDDIPFLICGICKQASEKEKKHAT